MFTLFATTENGCAGLESSLSISLAAAAASASLSALLAAFPRRLEVERLIMQGVQGQAPMKTMPFASTTQCAAAAAAAAAAQFGSELPSVMTRLKRVANDASLVCLPALALFSSQSRRWL